MVTPSLSVVDMPNNHRHSILNWQLQLADTSMPSGQFENDSGSSMQTTLLWKNKWRRGRDLNSRGQGPVVFETTAIPGLATSAQFHPTAVLLLMVSTAKDQVTNSETFSSPA
jgi:hypothetical protein